MMPLDPALLEGLVPALGANRLARPTLAVCESRATSAGGGSRHWLQFVAPLQTSATSANECRERGMIVIRLPR